MSHRVALFSLWRIKLSAHRGVLLTVWGKNWKLCNYTKAYFASDSLVVIHTKQTHLSPSTPDSSASRKALPLIQERMTQSIQIEEKLPPLPNPGEPVCRWQLPAPAGCLRYISSELSFTACPHQSTLLSESSQRWLWYLISIYGILSR